MSTSHGTPLRYGQGCRCVQCILATALRDQELAALERQAATRRPATPRRRTLKADRLRTGELAVDCWCGADVVFVQPEVVRALRTGSCGAAGCTEDVVA